MATGVFYPAASADDAHVGVYNVTMQGWDMANDGNYNQFGYDSETGWDYFWACRFTNVTIPKGATITAAHVQLRGGALNSGTTDINIHFKAEDNGSQPVVTDSDIPWWLNDLTDAVNWEISAAWSNDGTYESVDIKDILQGVVDRSGWASGNAATVVLKNRVLGSGGKRSAYFIDWSSGTHKAELHVTWEMTIQLSVNETIVLADSPTIPYYWDVVEETIELREYFATFFADVLEDGFGLADVSLQGLVYPCLVAEGIEFTEDELLIWYKSILDSVFIYDTPLPSWARTIADSLSLADSGATLMGVSISDWLWLIDSHVNKWKGQQVVPDERLSLYDLPGGAKIINRSLAETIDLADSVSLQFLLRLLEYMRFTDLASVVGKFKKGVADAILLADAPSRAFDRLVEETLTAIDSSAALAVFLSALTDDSMKFSDTSASGSYASKAVSDALFIGDAAGSGLIAFTIVQDSISLNVLVEIEGELYECYVLNTPKFLPSVYSGFDFNSYCTFEGKTYGANATGIYELAGGTDAGTVIQTGVVMPQTTFGIPDSKKLRRAWLGITGTSPALVLEVEDGTRKAYAIDSYGEVGSDREITGKKWKLSIANFDELDFIRILPVALVR